MIRTHSEQKEKHFCSSPIHMIQTENNINRDTEKNVYSSSQRWKYVCNHEWLIASATSLYNVILPTCVLTNSSLLCIYRIHKTQSVPHINMDSTRNRKNAFTHKYIHKDHFQPCLKTNLLNENRLKQNDSVDNYKK